MPCLAIIKFINQIRRITAGLNCFGKHDVKIADSFIGENPLLQGEKMPSAAVGYCFHCDGGELGP
jgi:hypothetical protein